MVAGGWSRPASAVSCAIWPTPSKGSVTTSTWRAPALDRDLTGAAGTLANSHDALANLAASLDSIRRRTTRLTDQIRAADLEPDRLGQRRGRLRCVPPPADPPLSAGL
jgi:hypothetical protein